MRHFLKNNHSLRVKAFGDSMLPLLQNGDVVVLKYVPFQKIKINDIVTFRSGKNFISHRVIYKAPKYLITKGDNNRDCDKKVLPSHMVGRVDGMFRNNRHYDLESLYLLQSSLYFQEIIKVVRLFREASINFLFLKGLPLHLYFEKTHPRRIYADCDILVERNSIEKIKNILDRQEYTQYDNSLSKFHQTLKDKETQISFYKSTSTFPIVFDIHTEGIFTITQLGSLNTLYPQKLISRATTAFLTERKTVKVHGESFPILTPENHILFLCHHLFRDNFKGSHKYDFLKTILKHYTKRNILDWDLLLQKTHEYQLDNIVYSTFLLLNRYYARTIPQKVLRKMKIHPVTKIYINHTILNTNIFETEDRVSAGSQRFIYQFVLSTSPLAIKLVVFFQLKVLYSIMWVFFKKIGFRRRLITMRLQRRFSLQLSHQ